MSDSAPPSFVAHQRTAAIVVAAGKGLRAGGAVPKQFAIWKGKPLLRHSLEALAQAGVTPIVVAIPLEWQALAEQAAAGIAGVRFVAGGDTRQLSVRAGLEALAGEAPDRVLIHDAARPGLSSAVLARLDVALDKHAAAIPTLAVVDSLVREGIEDSDPVMAEPVSRDGLHRVQTPQAFRFATILAAHRAWIGAPDAGDDAQVARAAGHRVALVMGDEALRKVTFAEDLEDRPTMTHPRTGTGFDVHRLVTGKDLWLCGIQIPHDMGLSGHSDADVAIHALVDALLGAVAAGDIGDHFPPSDPQWKGAPSHLFLSHAAQRVQQAGYAIGNVDVTILCEAPRIGPHKLAMRQKLAEILQLPVDCVSVKATTTEGLGFTGRGEGIAAQAVASVVPLA